MLFIRFAYRPYQFFKRRGIPHPPVVPLFGNAAQITREVSFTENPDKSNDYSNSKGNIIALPLWFDKIY